MNKYLKSLIIIKDYFIICLIIAFISPIFALLFDLKFKLDATVILSIEEFLFIILSAILLIMHETILSNKMLDNLSVMIGKFENEDIKKKIINVNDDAEKEEYDSMIKNIKNGIDSYKTLSRKYKLSSYKLYLLFSIVAIFVVCIIVLGSVTEDENINFIHIIYWGICTQISLLLIWIISAYQASMQKNDIFIYLKVESIIKAIQNNIRDGKDKSICDDIKEHTR